MDKDTNMPRVTAIVQKDGRWKILCPYCGEPHWHGAGEGVRKPHCLDNSGNYGHYLGYYLTLSTENAWQTVIDDTIEGDIWTEK